MIKNAWLPYLLVLFALAACAEAEPETLVIYSGRGESLVAPLIDQFQSETGIRVDVRYGGTAELAAALLEEGENSPADVFWAQDPGGLGAVDAAGRLASLPTDILDRVPPDFRSPAGDWVGVSGRARVVVYNTELLTPADLPDDLWGFTDPSWAGRIGWAPSNGSFQVMVTAMRLVWGETQARDWLVGIRVNNPLVYPNNTTIVAAVGAGEIDVGFVNHYYLYRFLKAEGLEFPARNYFLPSGGPGSLVMVAGAGILATTDQFDAAATFLRFLLDRQAQEYFATNTFEYPLLTEVPLLIDLAPLPELNTASVELADLYDLTGTIELLHSVGALP